MDELFVGFVGVFGSSNVGARWYVRLWHAAPPRTRAAAVIRVLFAVLPPVLLLGLLRVLESAAAPAVRESTGYTLLFLMLGVVWLAATVEALAWLGIDSSADAIERDNVAAGIAVCGALGAGTITFAFSNIGEGATIWTTLGPAALGFVACTGLWLLYQLLGGGADAIAIERDLASGLRFAIMALASSVVVGRPLAGDYVSVAATFRDFAQQAWPALPIVLLVAWLQRRASREVDR